MLIGIKILRYERSFSYLKFSENMKKDLHVWSTLLRMGGCDSRGGGGRDEEHAVQDMNSQLTNQCLLKGL